MKLKIYLFRHGLTNYNKHAWFTGQIDSKMTKSGIENAKVIGKKLRNKRIDIAYCSRLSRSKMTLKEVLKFHPECNETIVDDRMIERNYGKLQRHSHKEFMKEVEKLVIKALEKKYGKMKHHTESELGETVADIIYKTYHRSYDIPPPGGESMEKVDKRVRSFIKNLLKKMKKDKVNVAISAHNNSMRAFRKYFEKLSLQEMLTLENPHDDYFEYNIEV